MNLRDVKKRLPHTLPLRNLQYLLKPVLLLTFLSSLYLTYTFSTAHQEAEILWYTKLGENFLGQQGFVQEAFNFMIPLAGMLEFGWYAGSSLADVRINTFFTDLSDTDQAVLKDLFVNGARIAEEFSINNKVISIVFDQPSQYEDIFQNTRLKYSGYKVGRAMFETTWIPNNWEYYINEYLDELWVPSKFAKEVFKSAGIFKPIYVVREGFDPEQFKRTLDAEEKLAYRKMLYPNCLETDIIFLSVGKMERRKGVDILTNTFKNTFKGDETGGKACLYIRAEMNSKQRGAIKTFNDRGLRIYVLDRLSNEDLILAYQRYLTNLQILQLDQVAKSCLKKRRLIMFFCSI